MLNIISSTASFFFSNSYIYFSLVSYISVLGYHNKLPPNSWFKVIEIYSVIGPKAKTEMLIGPCSLSALLERIFPCLFQLRVVLVFMGLWQNKSHVYLHLHMAALSLCLSVSKSFFFSYKDTSHWISGSSYIRGNFISRFLTKYLLTN